MFVSKRIKKKQRKDGVFTGGLFQAICSHHVRAKRGGRLQISACVITRVRAKNKRRENVILRINSAKKNVIHAHEHVFANFSLFLFGRLRTGLSCD